MHVKHDGHGEVFLGFLVQPTQLLDVTHLFVVALFHDAREAHVCYVVFYQVVVLPLQ